MGALAVTTEDIVIYRVFDAAIGIARPMLGMSASGEMDPRSGTA